MADIKRFVIKILRQDEGGYTALQPSPDGPVVLYSDYESEVKRLRDALTLIAKTNHQSYDDNAPYVGEHSSGYAMGVADGHRCAAAWAQAALDIDEQETSHDPAQ